jgi:ABC-2 type transport system ATP-binding protein
MQDPDRVTDLLLTLRDAGIHLTELSVQKPTLDEVFLTLTGHGVEADDADAGASDTDRRLEGSRA